MDYEEKYKKLLRLFFEFNKAVSEIADEDFYEITLRKIAKEKGLEEYIDEALKNEQGTYKTKYEK